MENAYPVIVLLFSGKRKCGKDTLTDILFEAIGGERAVVIKISAPIKSHFAKSGGLDLQKLMGEGEYKETYRKEMIKWGEDIRMKDYGYFCRAAVELFEAQKKPIWIVSDIRRRTDVQWFSENFKDAVVTFRIVASDEIRKSRGWLFTEGIFLKLIFPLFFLCQRPHHPFVLPVELMSNQPVFHKLYSAGIDNAESECDLDTVDNWDHIIENNGSLENLKSKVDSVVNVINEKLLEKQQKL